jgi:site-specific DNA-methyltransferase (adenine-specific)
MKLPAKNGEMWMGDCLELMRDVPSGSVDMILCDLPYGTTACSWDSIIPFEPLWEQYWRIAKPNAAVVLTAAQPFTSALVMSQIDRFKYVWVWDKVAVTGFANAKRQPLRNIEDVCVFGIGQQTYNPQGLTVMNKLRKNSATDGGATVKGQHLSNGKGSLRTPGLERNQEFTNYPRQLLSISRDSDKIHPTQKPVALFEYLIKTYTNPGDIVLDNCIGSGTTAVAAENTGRRWLGIERDEGYFIKAWTRVMGL